MRGNLLEVGECWVLDVEFVLRVQTEVVWEEGVMSGGVEALRENRTFGIKLWKVEEGEEVRTERVKA